MEFDVLDWMEISGESVAIIRVSKGFNAHNLLNYEVLIDGLKFKILKVKSFAEFGDETEEIGLTVEPLH